jgi:excisionase family DNA binding protein
MTGPLLTTRQVAELLSVSPETVLRRVRAGQLPAFRIATNALRFDEDELQRWLEQRRSEPTGAER